VVDVILSHELVDQVWIVGVDHPDEGLGQLLSVRVHVFLLLGLALGLRALGG
jgi:hypothetical protein